MHFISEEWREMQGVKKSQSTKQKCENVQSTVSSIILHNYVPCIRLTVINARLQKRWTVDELAQHVNTTADTIKQIESGDIFPSAALIAALQESLSIQIVPN